LGELWKNGFHFCISSGPEWQKSCCVTGFNRGNGSKTNHYQVKLKVGLHIVILELTTVPVIVDINIVFY